jgi:CheY-like chemotaxis protein
MGLFSSSSRSPHNESLRVLVIAPDASRRAWVDRTLKQDDCTTDLVASAAEALTLLSQGDRKARAARQQPQLPFDAAVIDASDCTPATLKLVSELGTRHIASVLLCGSVSFDQALAAMKAGASDIVGADVKPKELLRRLRAAAKSSTLAHPGAASPHEPRSVGAAGLPKATPTGPSHTQSQPAKDALAAFKATIDGELDVESLLRHALEFVLAKVGPTNAAIFLPGSSGDYQLGAYVNYSAPKDTAEVMLDHLANVCAPRLDRTIGVIELCDAAAIEHTLGDGLDWLKGQRVMAFACRAEGDTLAVFMVFRDATQPFPASTSATLASLRDAFGAQLARVIRIHHRHLPRDKWGALGDGLDAADDDNLAA